MAKWLKRADIGDLDPIALLREVSVPTLVLATRPADPGRSEQEFLDMKRQAAVSIRRVGGPVSFEWIEGIHDVPLQRPKAVAARVRRFAADVLAGSGGSISPAAPSTRPAATSGSARSPASTS